ncbi:NADH-quinone oxidoreductase subunit C [Pontibacter sp. G13]|uniref:NADH-quinone oxidoreductase subunit C n=1 Tax=Pontibacter sp. G13 TaxID=3074898 RepID=UPI00288C0F56|nr:NADH-quinone oxidoreductase subunit C [Pontibacter sp. G13]WNJ19799.1 NADH-quinone oxidoreductase subunit C [Pontibacter sp. G13]
MSEQQHTFLDTIKKSTIQDFIVDVRGHANEMTIQVKAEHILEVLRSLKEQHGFNFLSDITGSDNYTDEGRFEVAYNIVSMAHRQRLRVVALIEESDPSIDSVVSLWSSANWYEREAYDMVGIQFRNHPDLRRIYMPEDFQWYPLRKEFPLLGIPGSIALPEKDPPKEYK